MNGKIVSTNPRLIIKNSHSSELTIKAIELSDEGQYECRTDRIVNYMIHLTVVNCKSIFLFFFLKDFISFFFTNYY